MTRFSGAQQNWVNNFLQLIGGSAQPAPLKTPYDAVTSAIAANDLAKATQAVNMLASSGLNLDHEDSNGETALTQAAKFGNDQIAQLLLTKGAKINALNNQKDTPLLVAVQSNKLKMAQWLLGHGALMNGQNSAQQTSLFIAVKNRNGQMRDLFLGFHADVDLPDLDGVTPLNLAALNGDFDSAKKLIEAGADVDQPSNFGFTPLMQTSDSKIAELLLEKGADPNQVTEEGGETILMLSARMGNAASGRAIGKALLSKKETKINARTKEEQKTALMVAAHNGHSDFVDDLLNDSRTDVNLKDKNGSTALMLAVKSADATTIQSFLNSNKVDLDAQDTSGMTALMLAVLADTPGLVAVMFSGKRKPKPDVPIKSSKNTALILAAEHGDVDSVKALISNGANKNIKNGAGKTAKDIATDKLNAGGSLKSEFAQIIALL